MSDKYKNGKIYTIRCKNDDSLIYVGSTVQPLFKRWHQHKSNVNNEKNKEYNTLVYQKIRETNNLNDWYIELYEEFPCENKEQLNKREGEIIREIGILNKLIAGRTKKEYYEDNKTKLLDIMTQYRQDNKDIIAEKNKKYRQDNKSKISEQRKEYRLNNKDKRKEYYESNKNKIKEYYESNKNKIKEYRLENKDKIKEYQKQYRESKQTQQIQ